MGPQEAHQRRDEFQLVDVREPEEWAAGHIEEAIHIPMGVLGQRQDELARDRTIVAVCRSGNRSGHVVRALRDAGYDAENLEGGMHAWAAAGLPFVADGDDDPHVA